MDNHTLIKKSFSEIIKFFFLFLLSGILFTILAQLSLSFESFKDNFIFILPIYFTFIVVVFLYNQFLEVKVKNLFLQYIIFYFSSGLSGLILIEWLINKNFSFNIFHQLFLFSFWAGMTTLPKLIQYQASREYKASFYEWLLLFFGGGFSLAAFIYFLTHSYFVWQVSTTILFILFNIFYWWEFFRIRKNGRTTFVRYEEDLEDSENNTEADNLANEETTIKIEKKQKEKEGENNYIKPLNLKNKNV